MNPARRASPQRVLRLAIGVALFTSLSGLTSRTGWAGVTSQDFEGGGTPFTLTQHAGSFTPVVLPGGPSGSFLRLTAIGVGGTINTIACRRTLVGGFVSVTADWDFRISPGLDTLGADGFSFVLLSSADFGTTGAAPSFFEEPDLTNSFGAGFDTFDNGGNDVSDNHVDLHFNGSFVAGSGVDLSPTGFDLGDTGTAFTHAHLSIVPTVGGSNVSLSLTPPGSSA